MQNEAERVRKMRAGKKFFLFRYYAFSNAQATFRYKLLVFLKFPKRRQKNKIIGTGGRRGGKGRRRG